MSLFALVSLSACSFNAECFCTGGTPFVLNVTVVAADTGATPAGTLVRVCHLNADPDCASATTGPNAGPIALEGPTSSAEQRYLVDVSAPGYTTRNQTIVYVKGTGYSDCECPGWHGEDSVHLVLDPG